jgi:hypothetical protein
VVSSRLIVNGKTRHLEVTGLLICYELGGDAELIANLDATQTPAEGCHHSPANQVAIAVVVRITVITVGISEPCTDCESTAASTTPLSAIAAAGYEVAAAIAAYRGPGSDIRGIRSRTAG